MRVLYKDLKRIKLVPLSVDDLFLLYQLIEPGDLVTKLSERKVEVGEKKEKVREKVKITLEVEEVDLKRWVNVLRISGSIRQAPEEISIGAHHSFNLDLGDPITIRKEWKPYQLKRLEQAKVKEPLVLVVAIDDERVGFGLVRRFKLESLGELRSYLSGKRDQKREERLRGYFGKVSKRITEIEADRIIIAGPGFTKDNLGKFLFERYPDLKEKVILKSLSYGGEAGVREALRRNYIQEVIKKSQIAKEIGVVNQFFKLLSKDPNLVKRGLAEVEKVAEYGAVKKLLVTDELLRKEKKTVEKVIEAVQQKRGEFYIISTEHEGGERLEGLGGIGAVLRYAIGIVNYSL